MRFRNAGAMARLLLIVALVVGTALSGVPSLSGPGDSSPDTPVVQGKGKDQNQKANKDKKPGKGKKGDKKSKGKSKNKSRNKNKKTSPALDAKAVAAENAAEVEALECEGLTKVNVDGLNFCTHGEDPQLFGAGTEGEAAGESLARSAASTRALCVGDGKSGPRVQLIYVHQNGSTDRLPELLPTFRRLAAEMDTIVDQSARKTGDSLRIRYVTDNQCQVDVDSLSVPSHTIKGFGAVIEKLREAGYNRLDRKYLMLVDSSVYCGIGSFKYSDSKNTSIHDFTGYARVDKPCWDAGTMIHELSHTLGGVQYSAPHTSRGAHCIDEWDVMCYRDEPHRPKMKILCEDGAGEFRLDCRDDDYFAAKPAPGSYLANHWNMADSIYFTDGSGDVCVDANSEPDDAFWYDYWGVPFPKFSVGKSAARAFCEQSGDVDWILFKGERGKSYQIETSDLGADVDTQLVLYRGYEEQHWGGMDRIAVNDDREEGDPSSSITFTAPGNASYLVGVSEAEERAGLDKTYRFAIKEVQTTSSGALTLNRTSAKAGGGFTATLSEVEPQATVTFWWERGGNATELGQKIASDDGVATGSFTVPKGASRGMHRIEAIGSDSSFASADFRVEQDGGRGDKSKKNKGAKGKKGKKGKKGHGRRGKH